MHRVRLWFTNFALVEVHREKLYLKDFLDSDHVPIQSSYTDRPPMALRNINGHRQEVLVTALANEMTHSVVSGDAMVWSRRGGCKVRPSLLELERAFGVPAGYITDTPDYSIAEMMGIFGNMHEIRELVDIVKQSVGHAPPTDDGFIPPDTPESEV